MRSWPVVRDPWRLGGSRPEVGSCDRETEITAVIEVGTGIKRTRRCQEFFGPSRVLGGKGGGHLPFFCKYVIRRVLSPLFVICEP